MKAVILQIAETTVDGVPYPVVPGSEMTVAQADSHYIAYGPVVPTPNGPHRGYHPVLAKLWRAKPGFYAVICEDAVMAKLDPTNKGKTFEQLAASPTDMASWPCKDEIDNSPRISSSLGLDDPRPVKRVKPTIEEVIPK
jgi:hypothetical protein